MYFQTYFDFKAGSSLNFGLGHSLFAGYLITFASIDEAYTKSKFKPFVYFPISFGIEGELKIKDHVYLIGSKIVSAFHENYYKEKDMANYYQVLIYIGTRIPCRKADKDQSEVIKE